MKRLDRTVGLKKRLTELNDGLIRLNRNITNPNVHPGKVYSIILFINELKKKGITKVKIPSMQVLSYEYHKILSKQVYENLQKIENDLKQENNDITNEEYDYVLKMYNNMYKKEDKISYLKNSLENNTPLPFIQFFSKNAHP